MELTMERILKTALVTAGLTAFFGMKVHATDLSKIHIQQPKPPQTYEVCDAEGKNCQEKNAAEATVAVLQGNSRVFIVTRKEMIIEAGKNGLNLKAKK
jgi:predicted transglutaminase-like cysteine proteinase